MIEKTYKRNWELIKENYLKVGDKLKLKESIVNFKKGDLVTIKLIHNLYGWILFEETEQLPQEVEELLKVVEVLK